MSRNPIINALSALGYIGLIAAVMNYISVTQGSKPDTVFAPVIFLSLLTFSVAVMACTFFYQPIQLFIEGKKKEALKLLVQTVGVFGVFTTIAVLLLFSGLL